MISISSVYQLHSSVPSSGLNAQIELSNVNSCFAFGKKQVRDFVYIVFYLKLFEYYDCTEQVKLLSAVLKPFSRSVTCLHIPPSQ